MKKTTPRPNASSPMASKPKAKTQNTAEVEEIEARNLELERTLARLTVTQAELQFAKEAAEAASQAKSVFLANMSHELRTPLNAIVGYSEMLQEEIAEAGQEELIPDLQKIHLAGKHLLETISHVLELSRIDAGQVELQLETFEVGTLVQEVVAVIRPLAEKERHKLQINCGDNVGRMRTDRSKLRRSLLNLLSNACKFTEAGTVWLDVAREIVPAAEGKDELIFSVRDSGIGMTAAELAIVFQPFVQADLSTTRKYGGLGLGLTLTKQYCELLGGELTVTSESQIGTAFTLRLPAESLPHHPNKQRGTVRMQRIKGSSTVLIIDDTPKTREQLQQFLRDEGFRVISAVSGDQGLRLARAMQPDAITLALLVSAVEGWAVLAKLKADAELATIPVIVLTLLESEGAGYALGAADYLIKPIEHARLLAVTGKYKAQTSAAASIALVIETYAPAREMLCEWLEKAGWQVVAAADGPGALAQMALQPPQLILLDLFLPEMGGFQFWAELHQHDAWRSIPVIVTTVRELSTEDRLRLNGYLTARLPQEALHRKELLREVEALVTACLQVRSTKASASAAPPARKKSGLDLLAKLDSK